MDKETSPQDTPAYRIREDKIDSLMEILHKIDNKEKTYCHIHNRMYNEDNLCDKCLEENNK